MMFNSTAAFSVCPNLLLSLSVMSLTAGSKPYEYEKSEVLEAKVYELVQQRRSGTYRYTHIGRSKSSSCNIPKTRKLDALEETLKLFEYAHCLRE